MLKQEADVIQHALNSKRMQGEIDFTHDVDHYKQNGNVYVEVTCTSQTAAAGVRQAFEEVLDDERVTNFRGPDTKNPATDQIYVYVVAEPPFEDG